jgi:hypothetical protein
MTIFDSAHLLVAFTTIVAVALAVTLHYEAFLMLSRWLGRGGKRGHRRILIMVLALMLVHVVEIWIFGVLAFWLLSLDLPTGSLEAVYPIDFLDYIYMSTVTYTTLGYGDIYATGPIRFLFGTEALTGFALITWSASLTFLEMQRHWRE